jgi:CheY-like chemotaxis protein
MSVSGKVLVVDDDPNMIASYRDILAPEGYLVETASDSAQAGTKLSTAVLDVVILDQKLQGPGGGDTGLSLIADIASTGAKVIVATGYASAEAIERAFRDGAYDYLEKGPNLGSLVRVKVRNAATEVQERRLASMTSGERENEIQGTWTDAKAEKNAGRKGKLLEDLMVLLFKTVPGLKHVDTRRKSRDEEIDLFLHNESSDPLWHKQSAYFLVECKNWSDKVGPDELDRFYAKLNRRFGQTNLGFLVSVNGFTEGFSSTLMAERKGSTLVVPVSGADMDALVNTTDRNAVLKGFHARTVSSASPG